VNHGIGGDPPEPPSPSSSSRSSSSSSHSNHSSFHPSNSKRALFKLDVKFNMPMFNGQANDNEDKINNWIKQIKFYYRVQ
jgi:hypothetical protein